METKKEVLIIGGGIIGLAIAYYLSRRGFFNEVMLVERDHAIVSHASGHNAGGISSVHMSQSPEMSALARKSSELYLELSRTNGFDFDFKVNGSLEIQGETDPLVHVSQFEEEAEIFRQEFLGKVELLSPKEINAKEPNLETKRISQALYYPDDAQGNSLKLGHSFYKACVEKGMTIETDSTVLGFRTKDHCIESVLTSKGTIQPKTVVVAGGPWSGKIASMLSIEIPVEPVKGHLITTHRADANVLRSFILGPNYYAMQIADGAVVVGGGEDSEGFDTGIIRSRIEEAWVEMSSFVPILNRLGQESLSACLRPFASDGLPIIGRSGRYENLFFATGHFRTGFSLAPVTGSIISELIVESNSQLELAPFSPRRFGA